ncbi:glycosyltransferase [Pseudohoeflea coraliihabitans]|uniref:Glycosyltransferase family 1 protein n=1 Tax=Pseudohoeflea coraliihabitans TaxID=2860393 RepID=A0ABS6WRD3_9HYPH|nr:glycosyltransferase family 1 protein [Pseudohoeflea sp. DP4N28-3]MBW3098345.1 glycosyltransferase family 1 protein [Pseudohoeflea sp. DP4N28-3]
MIYTAHAPYAPLGAAHHFGRRLADRPVLFLVWFSWTMREPRTVRMLATAVAVYRRRRPNHRIILMCNEEEERAAFAAEGVDAVLCSSNLFVDEETFRPLPGSVTSYDAVYNGAMVPWKRHRLSALIASCAHIFYRKAEYDKAMAYLAELRASLPHHTFINEVVDGNIQMIPAARVNSVLSQSRVGLCLSAEEGGMYASVEYLLAGLPVVSTPNRGGRDVFSDPDYWITAEESPEAIRDAVGEMMRRKVAPDDIRSRTLERIHQHRANLRSAVAAGTDGKVMLPGDLSAPFYRQMPVWETRTDLAARIGLTSERGDLAQV